ncbi:hypothetical protein J3E73DRAFT_262890 [Bipolaris maydis]|nr:hypothetical protein J3E73DRAFT_262890 [Bipolaris maydis]
MAIPGRFNRDAEAITGSIPGSQRSTFKCDTSRNFCLDEVVWAKGLDFQTLLHTYCLEQYEHAALSYHGLYESAIPNTPLCSLPWSMELGVRVYLFKRVVDSVGIHRGSAKSEHVSKGNGSYRTVAY